MYAVIGRVKIKPGHSDETLAMICDHGRPMLQGMTGSNGGYWARTVDGEDLIQHSRVGVQRIDRLSPRLAAVERKREQLYGRVERARRFTPQRSGPQPPAAVAAPISGPMNASCSTI